MAPDAMYLNDLNGVLLDGNTTAEALLGISRRDFRGKTIQELNILSEEETIRQLSVTLNWL